MPQRPGRPKKPQNNVALRKYINERRQDLRRLVAHSELRRQGLVGDESPDERRQRIWGEIHSGKRTEVVNGIPAPYSPPTPKQQPSTPPTQPAAPQESNQGVSPSRKRKPKTGDKPADEPVEPPLATPGNPNADSDKLNLFDPKVKAAIAAGKYSTPEGAAKAQQAQAKDFLDIYVRANGNMSVPRRLAVVGQPLVNLGYKEKDAYDIALDTPLNAASYNEDALYKALEYAYKISRPPDGTPGSLLNAAFRKGTTPADGRGMPPDAWAALLDGRRRAAGRTRQARQNMVSPFTHAATVLNSLVGPVMQRVGNLPVPGGIGGLLAINLFFLATIVPANPGGYTRAELLWMTLMNRTHLPPDPYGPVEAPVSPANIGLAQIGNAVQFGVNAISAVGQSGQVAGSAANIVGQGINLGINTAIQSVGGGPPSIQAQVPSSVNGSVPPPPPLPGY